MDNSKVIDLVTSARELVKRARAEATAVNAQREKAAAEIPAVVSELIRVKALGPGLRKKAEEALKDPVQSLRMLTKLASMLEARPAEPTPIGEVEQPAKKQAAARDDSRDAANAAYQKHMDKLREVRS